MNSLRTAFSTYVLYSAIREKEGPISIGLIVGALLVDAKCKQIVDVAYALLADGGLEGLTIRSVLAQSGLARRAFYDCFATKDDLVLAVFQHTLADAAAIFTAHIADMESPIDRLRYIITAIVIGHGATSGEKEWASNRRAAALSREHLRLAEARPLELQRAVAPLVGLIATQIEAGIKEGLVRQSNVERMGLLVYNLVSTTVHSQLIAEESSTPDLGDRTKLADEIWQFCLRAIAV